MTETPKNNNTDSIDKNNITNSNKNLAENTENTDKNVPAKKKDEDFDIADFIVKHYDRSYSVRKRSKIPMILAVAVTVALIVGLCVLAAMSFKKKLSIIGEWESEEGSKMTIIDTRISIDGRSMEYIIEEKNVISLKVGDEYFKIIYEITPSTLKFYIPSSEDEITEIKYKRIE